MCDAVNLDLRSVPRWCRSDGRSSRGGGRSSRDGGGGFSTTLSIGGAAGKKWAVTPLGGARGEPTNHRLEAPFSTRGRRGRRGQVGGVNSVRG
jgi:hypothetical protein